MKINNIYVEQVLKRVLSQTEKGKIEIGKDNYAKWSFFVKLFSNESAETNNGELSIKIQNKEKLIENIKQYLIVAEKFYQNDKFYFDFDDKSFHEKLVLDLFINATNFDLNNFEKYVEQKLLMIKGTDLTCDQFVMGEYLGVDIVGEIRKNSSNLEGPYKFEIVFDNNFESFILPSITFGKINDELFIYCIQGEKEKQTNKLSKQLDRHFRKANKGVDMEDEILSQVSVSALVSLVIFLAHEKKQGVKKINAYNFMPIRYNSNLTAKLNRAKNEELKQELEQIHDRNQYNITNKFFNTLIRYAHHFNLEFEYDDIYEKFELQLTDNEIKFDNIVFDIENAVLKTNEIEKTL